MSSAPRDATNGHQQFVCLNCSHMPRPKPWEKIVFQAKEHFGTVARSPARRELRKPFARDGLEGIRCRHLRRASGVLFVLARIDPVCQQSARFELSFAGLSQGYFGIRAGRQPLFFLREPIFEPPQNSPQNRKTWISGFFVAQEARTDADGIRRTGPCSHHTQRIGTCFRAVFFPCPATMPPRVPPN